MILVDTSRWIDYLNSGNSLLTQLLEEDCVLMHTMVLGEIALGNLKNRAYMLKIFGDLPQIKSASDEEILVIIEEYRLMGKGIGWVDAHLLTAIFNMEGTKLWTRDKRLYALVKELNLTYDS